MRVHIVPSAPAHHQPGHLAPAELTDLVQWLKAEGAVVSESEAVPPDADLYWFTKGHVAMKSLTRGVAILDLRHSSDLEAAVWAPYADFCLVRDAGDQAAMASLYDCEPERVFVLLDERDLRSLIKDALDGTLAPAEFERSEEPVTGGFSARAPGPQANLSPRSMLVARLHLTRRQADVMQRDYHVRSRVPVLGPVIAWLRRNLTSNLREPYLDPALDRQVAFNRELLEILEEVLDLQADLEARLARLEEEQDHE